MAILRDTRYPGRWAARNNQYPQGAFKNKSSPSATDGSYAEADWLNDWDGFFGRLMTVAGITPNGVVDNATSSQYYDALMVLFSRSMPSGAICMFGMTTPPATWVFCDGRALSRTANADLFNAIGTTWGGGGRVNNIQRPGLQRIFPACMGFGKRY